MYSTTPRCTEHLNDHMMRPRWRGDRGDKLCVHLQVVQLPLVAVLSVGFRVVVLCSPGLAAPPLLLACCLICYTRMSYSQPQFFSSYTSTALANPLPLHRVSPPDSWAQTQSPTQDSQCTAPWVSFWCLLPSSIACLLAGRALLVSCPNGLMPCMSLLHPVLPSCKSPLTYCRVTLRTSKHADSGDCDK